MRIGLSGKIVLIIGASVIFTAGIIGFMSVKMTMGISAGESSSKIISLAGAGCSQVSGMNEQEFTVLRSLACMNVFKDPDVSLEEKNKQLKGIIDNNRGKYEILSFFDLEGNGIGMSGASYDYQDKELFKNVIIKKEYVTEPIINKKSMTPYMSYSVPVTGKDNKTVIGAIVANIRGNRLWGISQGIDLGGGAHPVFVNTETGVILGDGNLNQRGQKEEGAFEYGDALEQMKIFIQRGIPEIQELTNSVDGKKLLATTMKIENSPGWSIVTIASYDEYYSMVYRFILFQSIAVFLVIIITAAIAGAIVKIMIIPLNKVQKSIYEISNGNADLTKRIDVKTKDEIGDVVSGFNKFIDMLQYIMRDIKMSKEKLTMAGQKLNSSTKDTTSSIVEILNNINDIQTQISNQNTGVVETAGAVNEIASNIESLELMIENQSNGVAKASTAIEEMIASIESVSKSVDGMASSFESLISSAQSGSELQLDVNEKIEEIRNKSESLQEANQAIAAIAEQTNLLAMNAAIEAAHAGEAGKGFSVVADEIRKLSETSSEQSRTIGDQLNSIRESIESVVNASEQSSAAFQNVTVKIQATDGIVRQIKGSLEEQTAGSKEINEALHSMNDSTSEVRIASKEMAEGNKSILEQVRNLQDYAGQMKNNVDGMAAGASRINDTSNALVNISQNMESSIIEIGGQVDQFNV